MVRPSTRQELLAGAEQGHIPNHAGKSTTQLAEYAVEQTKENTRTLEGCEKIAQEAIDMGRAIEGQLASDQEKLNNINRRLVETEAEVKFSNKLISYMRLCCCAQLCWPDPKYEPPTSTSSAKKSKTRPTGKIDPQVQPTAGPADRGVETSGLRGAGFDQAADQIEAENEKQRGHLDRIGGCVSDMKQTALNIRKQIEDQEDQIPIVRERIEDVTTGVNQAGRNMKGL